MLMLDQGLPKEWQRLINESGISEKERRENPQTMVDILQFYKETTERPPEDQSLEKFHHAGAADPRQYGVTPTSPSTYPSNYFGMFVLPRMLALCAARRRLVLPAAERSSTLTDRLSL